MGHGFAALSRGMTLPLRQVCSLGQGSAVEKRRGNGAYETFKFEMVAVIFIGIAYSANRFASVRQSSALFYEGYAFAFFFVFALLSAKSFDGLLPNHSYLRRLQRSAGQGLPSFVDSIVANNRQLAQQKNLTQSSTFQRWYNRPVASFHCT